MEVRAIVRQLLRMAKIVHQSMHNYVLIVFYCRGLCSIVMFIHANPRLHVDLLFVNCFAVYLDEIHMNNLYSVNVALLEITLKLFLALILTEC